MSGIFGMARGGRMERGRRREDGEREGGWRGRGRRGDGRLWREGGCFYEEEEVRDSGRVCKSQFITTVWHQQTQQQQPTITATTTTATADINNFSLTRDAIYSQSNTQNFDGRYFTITFDSKNNS